MASAEYSTFLARTAQLHEAVGEHCLGLQIPGRPRIVLSYKACRLSLQLAAGALRLAQENNVSAAMALIRPQFECLVRGMWLMYVASDDWIEKLSRPLTADSAKKGSGAPMLSKMLDALGKATEPRLQFMVQQLQSFHENGKVVLNSFVHGGMVPLARADGGYSESMVLVAIQNSSGALILACQLLTALTGKPENMGPVHRMFDEFEDCLKFERGSFEGDGGAWVPARKGS